jgi:hypothetical protein
MTPCERLVQTAQFIIDAEDGRDAMADYPDQEMVDDDFEEAIHHHIESLREILKEIEVEGSK